MVGSSSAHSPVDESKPWGYHASVPVLEGCTLTDVVLAAADDLPGRHLATTHARRKTEALAARHLGAVGFPSG